MTDNEQLLQLQADYKNGDNAALSRMYTKLFEIAYKVINTRSCSNEAIKRLSAAERKQKAHDAATYIIEQYLKRPAFEIADSMTGYLFRRISYELYGRNHQRACDKMLVFTDKLPAKKKTRVHYMYIVKDTATGTTRTYASAGELYLNPDFKGLRKKRLAEAIRTGRKWKKYTFDILEVNE